MGAATLGSDDPIVWTPSAVKAEMDRVLGVLDTVNADVSAAYGEHKISASEWKQWRKTYEAGHAFARKSSHLWGSNVKAARRHEAEALKWRELVAGRGGKLQGPDLRQPNEFPTTKVALAVGGVAAAAFLITSLRKKY
jgi:hypothetical protein